MKPLPEQPFGLTMTAHHADGYVSSWSVVQCDDGFWYQQWQNNGDGSLVFPMEHQADAVDSLLAYFDQFTLTKIDIS